MQHFLQRSKHTKGTKKANNQDSQATPIRNCEHIVFVSIPNIGRAGDAAKPTMVYPERGNVVVDAVLATVASFNKMGVWSNAASCSHSNGANKKEMM